MIAAAIAAASRAVPAQSTGKVFQVGLMANSIPAAELANRTTANPGPKIIDDGFRDLGWIDGKNVRLVWRTVEGRYDRWGSVIEEFVRMRVDVIVVFDSDAAKIALDKTRSIPVVLAGMGALLQPKIIDSLQRPGGNLTGMSIDGLNLGPKRLELLKATVPTITRVGFIVHLAAAADRPGFSPETEAAARNLGLSIFIVRFEKIDELAGTFSELVAKGANAIYVGESPYMQYRHFQLPVHELAIKHRLPAMYRVINSAESGGLMSYGPDILEFYRGAPRYADKILRGAKPGDLPIEMPSKFQFIINLKAAKAIGLRIPSLVLALADRVIE